MRLPSPRGQRIPLTVDVVLTKCPFFLSSIPGGEGATGRGKAVSLGLLNIWLVIFRLCIILGIWEWEFNIF
jgi:hypothetical protein